MAEAVERAVEKTTEGILVDIAEAITRNIKVSKNERQTFKAIKTFLKSKATPEQKEIMMTSLTEINEAFGEGTTRLTILQAMRLMLILLAKHPEKLLGGNISVPVIRRLAIMLTVPILQPSLTALVIGGSVGLITRVVTRMPKIMRDIDKWKRTTDDPEREPKGSLFGRVMKDLKGKPTPQELALVTAVVLAVFSLKRVNISNPVIRDGWARIPNKIGFSEGTAKKLDSYLQNIGRASDYNMVDRLVAKLPEIE